MATIYPEIRIERIKKPNQWYAVPLFGFLYKVILVIPVWAELMLLEWARFVFSILNACNIFFRGRYWKMAYELNLGIMRLSTNTSFFLWGLTDTYPGFSLQTTDYDLDMGFNKTPNRILATPLLGMLFRLVLLIPYLIYQRVLYLAAFLAIVVSWAVVLFTGKYPETTYEIVRDSIRVSQAISMYFLGMADSYPSWYMSFNHKRLKITLLVLAVILTFWTFLARINTSRRHRPVDRYQNTVQTAPPSYAYQQTR